MQKAKDEVKHENEGGGEEDSAFFSSPLSLTLSFVSLLGLISYFTKHKRTRQAKIIW